LVHACPIVQTRVAVTLVDICLTPIPGKSWWTSAVKTVHLVNACPIVQTRVAVTLVDIFLAIFSCESVLANAHIAVFLVQWDALAIVLTRPAETRRRDTVVVEKLVWDEFIGVAVLV